MYFLVVSFAGVRFRSAAMIRSVTILSLAYRA